MNREIEFARYCKADVKNTIRLYKILKRQKKKDRVIAFLKRHRTAIITILSAAALFIAFFILNGIANAWRGYKAIGGEIFVFIIPLLVVIVRDGIHEFINRMK